MDHGEFFKKKKVLGILRDDDSSGYMYIYKSNKPDFENLET